MRRPARRMPSFIFPMMGALAEAATMLDDIYMTCH